VKRFSKSIFLALMIIVMAIALVGCKSASVEKGEPVEPAPVEPAPAEPAPVEPAPAEPVAEQKPAEKPAEQKPAEGLKYFIGENEITVTAADGHAVIVYPAALFTEADILKALDYAVTTYPALATYVTYEFVPGKLEFHYPAEWDSEDYQLAEALVIGYVNEVLSDLASEVSQELVSTSTAAMTTKYTLTMFGYDFSLEHVADEVIQFTYPEVITKEEIKQAAAAAYEAYADYLEGTVLAVDDGKATLYLPYSLAPEEFNFAAELLAAELKWYVSNVLEAETAPILTKHIDILGYDTAITYANRLAIIDYPDFITKEEVAAAAQLAYASFAQYLEGTELSIDEGGVATLKFPVDITEADFDYAIALLDSYLPSYIAAIMAPSQEAAEAAAKAAEEAAAQAEAEKAAEAAAKAAAEAATAKAAAEAAAKAEAEKAAAEAAAKAAAESAAKASVTETVTKAAEEAVSTAKAEKKSNVGLIIVIVLLVLAAGAACFILLKKKKK